MPEETPCGWPSAWPPSGQGWCADGVHQVSGTVVVVVGTGGAVSAGLGVSGTVTVVTASTGSATRVAIVHQVSGTIPVATNATGGVTSRQQVSGVVPVVSDALGTIAARLRVSGTVEVLTAVSGVLVLPIPTTGRPGNVEGPSHVADIDYGISNDADVLMGDWASTAVTGSSSGVVSRPGRFS
jgi:hypothetical protein